MIESIIGILTIGFLLGAPAGFSPGPMMVLIIAETLRHGIRAGAKVAFMPLLMISGSGLSVSAINGGGKSFCS